MSVFLNLRLCLIRVGLGGLPHLDINFLSGLEVGIWRNLEKYKIFRVQL